MKNLIPLGILTAIALAMIGQQGNAQSSRASQPASAVYHPWAAGAFSVTVRGASTQTQTGRKDGPQIVETETRYELLVHEPDAKGQKVQITFRRLLAQGGGLGKEAYDTEKPAGEDVWREQSLLKAVIGIPLTATLSPDGEVGEIEGIDKVLKNTDDHPIREGMLPRMCEIWVKSAVATLAFRFPAGPLVKGYAWSDNAPMGGLMGKISMTRNYKVADVVDTPDGKVAIIEFTAKNTANKPVTDEDSAKSLVLVDEITSQTTGMLKLNLDTRMIVHAKQRTTSTSKGTALMDGGKLPFNFATESDTEILVTPVKTPATTTRPK